VGATDAYARAIRLTFNSKVLSMKQRRRLSGLVLTCLSLTLLTVVVAAPADAARRNLHKGSRGTAVTVLETRLARLSFLTPSAVDRRFRAATVNAVRNFQWRLGIPPNGRVNQRTWTAIEREPARRAGLRAPTVIGHRGQVAGGIGENTVKALQYAAPYADFLEFDLHLTADRELVLMHDTTLRRTTNCSGKVSAWTLADLRAKCLVGDQPIPTFDEAAAYAASVGKPISPELKDAGMSRDDLTKVVSVINAHGLAGSTWVQSVFGSHFKTLRELEPRLRTVIVSLGAPSPTTVTAAGAAGVATPLGSLTIPRVGAYHGAGVRVWGWTARSTADLQLARAMRVDSVVTDVPSLARQLYR
jgi:glycerophosphoryl diester phosphodiesterase